MSYYIREPAETAGLPADLAVTVVSGVLDLDASPELRGCFTSQIAAGRRRLVVDLSEVSFIDSTAIGVLVGTGTGLRESGEGWLAVVCPEANRQVYRIFEITRFESVVEVHPSLDSALSTLDAAA